MLKYEQCNDLPGTLASELREQLEPIAREPLPHEMVTLLVLLTERERRRQPAATRQLEPMRAHLRVQER